MRKSLDLPAAGAVEAIQLDPVSGHLFVFRSGRGDRLKIQIQSEALNLRRSDTSTHSHMARNLLL